MRYNSLVLIDSYHKKTAINSHGYYHNYNVTSDLLRIPVIIWSKCVGERGGCPTVYTVHITNGNTKSEAWKSDQEEICCHIMPWLCVYMCIYMHTHIQTPIQFQKCSWAAGTFLCYLASKSKYKHLKWESSDYQLIIQMTNWVHLNSVFNCLVLLVMNN